MHYLVAIHREGSEVTEADMEGWAKAGEPVVPNFPTGAENTFLGTDSFKHVPYAEVVRAESLDLDGIRDRLVGQFPGLPVELHGAYVMHTSVAASKLPLSTVVQVFIDTESAKICAVGKDYLYTLWDKQPIPSRWKT